MGQLVSPLFIFNFFCVTFACIQPSKVIAAAIDSKVILAQFMAPVILYGASLVTHRKVSQIKLHAGVLAGQALILGVHLLVANIYLNLYLAFFLLTPHLVLCISDLLRSTPNLRFLFRTISAYIIISFVFALASAIKVRGTTGLWDTFGPLMENLFDRENKVIRMEALDCINFAKHLFGLRDAVLEGVALTVYPLVLVSLCFLRPTYSRELLVRLALVCSGVFLLIKSSRGEALFIASLGAFVLVRHALGRIKWLALPVIGLGYVQLYLGSQTLNGRNVLNELFKKNISIVGQGVGFSAQEILALTKNNYSSFHNIHFELITNLGLIVYCGFIAFSMYYVLSRDYTRYKHYFLCLMFVLLATNFEMFDIYFAVPLAILLSNETLVGQGAISERDSVF